jgi:2-keto-3-deoxy-L-rhamnonate aldolase RhmA
MNRDPFLDEHGKPRRLRGVTIYSGSPLLAGLAARVGFEVVWIEMEHGPASFESVESLCLAARANGALPLVRLPDGERHHVLRALESGGQLLVVPMIDTPEQARCLVEYGKFAPVGRRGFNLRTWGVEFGLAGAEAAFAQANERVRIFAQIETVRAVQNLDALCEVEGLDGIFIGPGDLSVSLGHPALVNHPEVIEIALRCLRRAQEAGKRTGVLVAPGALLNAMLEAGVDLVLCGGDVVELAASWPKLLASIPGR